jgi:hypothetical protein
MSANTKEFRSGDKVIVSSLPAGFLDGLDSDDQQAILEILGKPVTFNEIDEHGRAELMFTDCNGIIHFVWIEPAQLKTEN